MFHLSIGMWFTIIFITLLVKFVFLCWVWYPERIPLGDQILVFGSDSIVFFILMFFMLTF